jgi:Flp pilus assembly protein TadG
MPIVTRETGPRWKQERGQTLVEFAVSFVVFLATVLGTMVLGLAVFRYNMISDLAQEGARRASVCGKNTGLSSTECNISNFVQTRSLGISTSVTVSPPVTDLDAGEAVTVQVQHTFASMTAILPVGSLTFTSSATMIASH